jgi:hypothetical protein
MLVAIALCATAACGDRSGAAQVDSSTGRSAGGVAARVSAPAAARPEDPALRAATAAFDSLSRSFTRARASLDSEALSLRDANRLDSAYAPRYAAFERRRTAAAELRTARDRARRVRDSLAAHVAHSQVEKH